MNRQSFFLYPTIRQLQETATKSWGKNFATRMSPFFLFSLATLLFLSAGCGSKDGQANGIADTSSIATAEVLTVQSDMNSFLNQETDLTSFKKMMENIHSLKTLTQVKSKQVILFAPSDQAFEKLGDAEKEKLLDSNQLSRQHEIFKNSVVLHDKNIGDWDGQEKTYGGSPINLDLQKGIVTFENNQARILKQINLEGGHLLYMIDNILT